MIWFYHFVIYTIIESSSVFGLVGSLVANRPYSDGCYFVVFTLTVTLGHAQILLIESWYSRVEMGLSDMSDSSLYAHFTPIPLLSVSDIKVLRRAAAWISKNMFLTEEPFNLTPNIPPIIIRSAST